jgi:PIN domain nuclease of toxin-antitoxin system
VILLLDAHALVWWLADDQSLDTGARAAIRDPRNDVVVSASTIWELAIKRAKGKIELPVDLTAAVHQAGFSGLPVTSEDAERASSLPAHHQDPFDRMLVAQAQRLGAIVVTRDRAISAYEVDTLPA